MEDLLSVTFTDGKVIRTRFSKYDGNVLTISFLDPEKLGLLGKDGITFPLSEVASIRRYDKDGGIGHENILTELLTYLRMNR